MKPPISVVVNTYNEEINIARCLKSVSFVDEIIVCDMHSSDKTVEIARKLGAKIYYHQKEGFVEPARNFAISKATNEWILVLDADEEISATLAEKLKEIITNKEDISYMEIPRKNIIFNKWMKASGWWPDYQVRFFKKGTVEWSDKIHSKPKTKGQELRLLANEDLAIIHHHYSSISQFVERMNRYTDIQAKQISDDGYRFKWQDLIIKPVDEFLSRFFANQGFEDGLHGLALGLLQGFSHLLVYLKIWELEKFTQQSIDLKSLKTLTDKKNKEIVYWYKYSILSQNPLKRIIQKAKNKLF
jgi:glycosyltransferase involved in cell wall biosynthesis